MKKIFVISPNHRTTGGVELLHQFVDQANKLGGDAKVVYFPFHRGHRQPEAYQKYNAPQALIGDIDLAGSVVLIPETLTHLVSRFTQASVGIWWLSVDNYFGSQKLRFLAANRIWPFTHWAPDSKRSVFHLSQSQYAMDFLKTKGIANCDLMTDYLNEDFLLAAGGVDVSRKERLVAFNPAKGLERTEAVLAHLPSDIEVVALQGLTRSGMVDVLARAKVYIDFGNHPGKDRIPREAAVMQCCVVTNRRGSAHNAEDVPIPDMYKIEDTNDMNWQSAAKMIVDLVDGYDRHTLDFEIYRQSIKRERSEFSSQVQRFLVGRCGGS